MGTLSHLSFILKEDQSAPQILRNALTLLVALLNNPNVVSYYKANHLPEVAENLCSDDDKENLKLIRSKLS